MHDRGLSLQCNAGDEPGIRRNKELRDGIGRMFFMIEWWLERGYFRNANHAIWFINSTCFIVFYLLIRLDMFGRFALLLPVILHTSPIVNSIRKTYIKKEKSEIYSVDCIWFNAIMVLLYALLMYAF